MSTTSAIIRPTPAEPAVLDDGMTRADIIDVLRWLQFPHKGRCLIELDRGSRDFLVGVLRDLAGKPLGQPRCSPDRRASVQPAWRRPVPRRHATTPHAGLRQLTSCGWIGGDSGRIKGIHHGSREPVREPSLFAFAGAVTLTPRGRLLLRFRRQR